MIVVSNRVRMDVGELQRRAASSPRRLVMEGFNSFRTRPVSFTGMSPFHPGVFQNTLQSLQSRRRTVKLQDSLTLQLCTETSIYFLQIPPSVNAARSPSSSRLQSVTGRCAHQGLQAGQSQLAGPLLVPVCWARKPQNKMFPVDTLVVNRLKH